MAWMHLSSNSVAEMREATDPAALLAKVAASFELEGYELDARKSVTLDLYTNSISCGLNAGFSDEKLSAFFSICKVLHDDTIANDLSLDQSYELFREKMVIHSRNKEGECVRLFEPSDIKTITEHVVSGYLRHHRLYKHCFKGEQEEDKYTANQLVCTAWPVPPLAEAQEEVAPEAAAEPEAEPQAEEAEAKEEAEGQGGEEGAEEEADPVKAAIAAAVSGQVEALSAELHAKWDAQMKLLRDRITVMEAK